jgi:DNA-binding winged helix-turn-helix (wHTH) protein
MRPNNLPRCVRFGPYQADFHTQELRKHGMKLKLSGQPLQILEMLLARPGQLVTREELQKQLWTGDVFVDSNHGLNAAVNKLRDALGDSAEEPKYIETLPRRGYRFIGTIQSELSPPTQPARNSGYGCGSDSDSDSVAPRKSGKTACARRAQTHCSCSACGCCAAKPGWALATLCKRSDAACWAASAVFLSRNQEMAENILRMVRKDVAENLAAAAKSSQAHADARRLNAGEASIPEGKNIKEAGSSGAPQARRRGLCWQCR